MARLDPGDEKLRLSGAAGSSIIRHVGAGARGSSLDGATINCGFNSAASVLNNFIKAIGTNSVGPHSPIAVSTAMPTTSTTATTTTTSAATPPDTSAIPYLSLSDDSSSPPSTSSTSPSSSAPTPVPHSLFSAVDALELAASSSEMALSQAPCNCFSTLTAQRTHDIQSWLEGRTWPSTAAYPPAPSKPASFLAACPLLKDDFRKSSLPPTSSLLLPPELRPFRPHPRCAPTCRGCCVALAEAVCRDMLMLEEQSLPALLNQLSETVFPAVCRRAWADRDKLIPIAVPISESISSSTLPPGYGAASSLSNTPAEAGIGARPGFSIKLLPQPDDEEGFDMLLRLLSACAEPLETRAHIVSVLAARLRGCLVSLAEAAECAGDAELAGDMGALLRQLDASDLIACKGSREMMGLVRRLVDDIWEVRRKDKGLMGVGAGGCAYVA